MSEPPSKRRRDGAVLFPHKDKNTIVIIIYVSNSTAERSLSLRILLSWRCEIIAVVVGMLHTRGVCSMYR